MSRLCIVGILLVSGCRGTDEPVPVHLGHVATLSGLGKQPGEQAVHGIRLAVEEIDKDVAKYLGRKVVVRHTDAKDSLDAFETEAVRLAAVSQVRGLYGGLTEEEVRRLDLSRVPVVTPLGLRPRTLSDLVFSIGITPEVQGKTLAQYIAEELNTTAVLVLVDDSRDESLLFSEAFARGFVASWKRKHGEETALPRVLRFGTDRQLAKLAADMPKLDANVLVFAGTARDLKNLPGAWLKDESTLVFAGDDGSLAGAETTVGRPMVRLTAFHPDGSPRGAEFARRYRDAFKEAPGVQAALAYEGIMLLVEALRTGQAPAPDKIRDELLKIKDFSGLSGKLAFTAERQLARPVFVVHSDGSEKKLLKRYDP